MGYVFMLKATGLKNELEAMCSGIKACATRVKDNSYEAFRIDLKEWPDCPDTWREDDAQACLWASDYWVDDAVPQSDGVPVRVVGNRLILLGTAFDGLPFAFANYMSRTFGNVTVSLSFTLGCSEHELWEFREGEAKLIERMVDDEALGAIRSWWKGGRMWRWTGDRDHDVRNVAAFVRMEVDEHPNALTEDELLRLCEKAYEAIAYPYDTCHWLASGAVYHAAKSLVHQRQGFYWWVRHRKKLKAEIERAAKGELRSGDAAHNAATSQVPIGCSSEEGRPDHGPEAPLKEGHHRSANIASSAFFEHVMSKEWSHRRQLDIVADYMSITQHYPTAVEIVLAHLDESSDADEFADYLAATMKPREEQNHEERKTS